MIKKIKLFLITFITIITTISFCACGDKTGNIKEEPKYKINYATDGNGTIQGESEQNLKTGEETSEVTAVPNEGYIFVKWSDEKTEAARTDTAEDKDLTLTAKFEKCKYTLTYYAIGGGWVNGELRIIQTVEYGDNAATVEAIPLDGFVFGRWSDNGSTDPVRTDINVTAEITVTAFFDIDMPISRAYDVSYLTDGNGSIEGKGYQRVTCGNDATSVTAIPNEGYEFVQWSDGVTTAERRDLNVKEPRIVTAQFKRVYKKYELNYKLGESDLNISDIKFYYGNFETVNFPVPTRDLFTFGGWYIGDAQVADITGKMTIGEELLEREEKEIYAKWTANEHYKYKILMVYVTELDATIPSVKGNGDFEVYYKMSDFDFEICKSITVQLSNYLNEMLDGLVTFEIDEYFTTVPVGNESISNDGKNNYIFANNIPEIYNTGMDKGYRSVLTTCCMNDYKYELCDCGGIATENYGCIFLESLYIDNIYNNEPLENILDLNYWRWNKILGNYLHELAHTIELQMYGSYEYHSVMNWFYKQGIYDSLIMDKLYYLNQVEIDGKKVGIPIEFWKGNWNWN